MKIYAAKAENAAAVREDSLIAMLDKDRQDKVHRITNQAQRMTSIYAGLLLRYAYLEEGYLQTDWDKVQIVQEEHGKPRIAGADSFAYSLSHSGHWVICAVDQRAVGADIQQMRPERLAVAKRFYHDTEYERLCRIEEEKVRTKHFYCMWAAKESYAKLTGRGIGAGIDGYLTQEHYNQIQDIKGGCTAFMKIYEEIPEYMVSVCSFEKAFPERLTIVTL